MCLYALTAGVSLSIVQMGIFTELAILYSKYRPEKRKLALTVLGNLDG